MATKGEYEKAAEAVEAGVATDRQKALNASMAQQAGPLGRSARSALQDN